jgi:choline dehydrogenase-like flavoprotein
MGTTMMSNNNKIGVVNENLRLHYRHNVFICSSSVFPTGGVAHPTFTICALAIRLADFLSRKFS